MSSSSRSAHSRYPTQTPTPVRTGGPPRAPVFFLALVALVGVSISLDLVALPTVWTTTDSTSQNSIGLARNIRDGETEKQEAEATPQEIPIPTSSVPTPDPTVQPTSPPTPAPTIDPKADPAWRPFTSLAELSEYTCKGWRQTSGCSPYSAPEAGRDRPCGYVIPRGASGYCEIVHSTTGEVRRIRATTCRSRYTHANKYSCNDAIPMLRYNLMALEYTPEVPLSYEQCRHDLLEENGLLSPGPASEEDKDEDDEDEDKEKEAVSVLQQPVVNFTTGIAYVIYEELLLSVYASVRSLRAMGCALPIELWYIATEVDPTHPILTTLKTHYHTFLREIRRPPDNKFYTKIYAVFYSAFDRLLLLDADNYAARDPTFLFQTETFQREGAIFWPDFWRANRTIFGLNSESAVWDVLGIKFVDMFEQESGQVVIDRVRHPRALHALLHYATTQPHYGASMNLWGDKDLYRLAWMRTNSSFHMIERPAGSTGLFAANDGVFCGNTMTQHDPDGEILFLHRNIVKLTPKTRERLWTHVQQYKKGQTLQYYDVGGVVDKGRFPLIRKCYGKHSGYASHYTVTPIGELPFRDLEEKLIGYILEGEQIVQGQNL